MKTSRIISLLLVLFGFIFVFNSLSGITGNIIIEKFDEQVSSIFGLVLILLGLIVFLSGLEKNLAQEVMESGAVITDPRKLRKIATRMGYSGRNVKEGYQILDRAGKPLTVIPRHLKYGTYKSIIEALATGESSFRKRAYSH